MMPGLGSWVKAGIWDGPPNLLIAWPITPGMKITHLLNKLARAEARHHAVTFVAPAVGAGGVTVRVAGVATRYELAGRAFGYGVFRADGGRAVWERRATLAEARAYLAAFPARPVYLIAKADDGWLAWPCHAGDARFGEAALVVVHFADDVQPMDRVDTRFDGGRAWFDELDDRREGSAARFLRAALRDRTPPDAVAVPGLTPEHRHAYRLAWRLGTGHAEAPVPPPTRAWEVAGLNLGAA